MDIRDLSMLQEVLQENALTFYTLSYTKQKKKKQDLPNSIKTMLENTN